MSDFCTTHTRRARKHYRCEVCSIDIRPGDGYAEQTGVSEGRCYRVRSHIGCRGALYAAREPRQVDGGPHDISTCVDYEAVTGAVMAAVSVERWAVRVWWVLAHQQNDAAELPRMLNHRLARAARRDKLVAYLHERDARVRRAP